MLSLLWKKPAVMAQGGGFVWCRLIGVRHEPLRRNPREILRRSVAYRSIFVPVAVSKQPILSGYYNFALLPKVAFFYGRRQRFAKFGLQRRKHSFCE